jgi:ectoine hydroxylase-related dioxygenase (phytanoyl-CoA dioxygenase family)
MSSYDRDDISIPKEEATKQKILEYCERYGVCIIDSFFAEETIEALRQEYEELYDNGQYPAVQEHSDEEHTQTRYINYDELNKEKYSKIEDVVENPLFEDVTRSYFEEEDVLYPSNLWAAKSKGTPDAPTGTASDGPPYAYHFDRQNNFKFLFYLSDVGIDDGPTHFVPENHMDYKQHRLDYIDAGKDIWEISNVMWKYHVGDSIEEMEVPVVGDAGTLVIFDTDTPHRAGDLSRGHQREIMRIDTISPSHSGVSAEKYNSWTSKSKAELVKQGIQNPGKAVKTVYGTVVK